MGVEEWRRILDEVKGQRRDEAQRAAEILGAEIEFFDAGDYPLRTTPGMLDRLVDVYRDLKPSFVRACSKTPTTCRSPGGDALRAGSPYHRPGRRTQAEPRSCLQRPAGLPVRAAPARAVQLQAERHTQHRRCLGDEAQGLRDPRCAKHLGNTTRASP